MSPEWLEILCLSINVYHVNGYRNNIVMIWLAFDILKAKILQQNNYLLVVPAAKPTITEISYESIAVVSRTIVMIREIIFEIPQKILPHKDFTIVPASDYQLPSGLLLNHALSHPTLSLNNKLCIVKRYLCLIRVSEINMSSWCKWDEWIALRWQNKVYCTFSVVTNVKLL